MHGICDTWVMVPTHKQTDFPGFCPEKLFETEARKSLSHRREAQERTLGITSSNPQKLSEQPNFSSSLHPGNRTTQALGLKTIPALLALHFQLLLQYPSLGQPTKEILVRMSCQMLGSFCGQTMLLSGQESTTSHLWPPGAVWPWRQFGWRSQSRRSQLPAWAPGSCLCSHLLRPRICSYLLVFILETMLPVGEGRRLPVQLKPKESIGQKVPFPARRITFRQISESIKTG